MVDLCTSGDAARSPRTRGANRSVQDTNGQYLRSPPRAGRATTDDRSLDPCASAHPARGARIRRAGEEPCGAARRNRGRRRGMAGGARLLPPGGGRTIPAGRAILGAMDVRGAAIDASRPRCNRTWSGSAAHDNLAPSEASAPMRATIVYGFLGAGKTTLLRALVPRLAALAPTALIVNEFGIEGVDQVVLASDALTVRRIAGGCVCCEVRGELLAALQELRRAVGPRRIVVEPTGLASPATLGSLFASPAARDLVTVDSIVTVVDASTFARMRDGLGEFYPQQVRGADLVLVNKTDLASSEQRREARAWVRELNAEAAVVETSYCNVDLDLAAAAIRQGRVRAPAPERGPAPGAGQHDGLAALGLQRVRLDASQAPVGRAEAFARALAAGDFGEVVRAKGFLPAAHGAMLIDVILDQWEARAFGGAPAYVDVIGRNLNTQELEAALRYGNKEFARAT